MTNIWEISAKRFSSFDLNGKVALITGAGGLLGSVHAKELASAGADLILTDLKEESCVALAAEIDHKYSVHAIARSCDVTNEKSWEVMLASCEDELASIDILVNNAGYTNKTRSPGYDAAFEDFSVEDWHAVLNVNLTGTFLGCKVVGRRMLTRGAGSIINIASLYGVVSPNHPMYEGTGVTQPAAYSVSKAGVIGLTRYLGTLWAQRGVRVNCITPGGVFNGHSDPFLSRFEKLNPIGRMASPHEIGGAVVFLASEASRYCVGHNLIIDGGWTVW